MKQLIIMDRTGDTRITLSSPAAIAEADKQFKELMARGYWASEVVDGERRLTRSFNPEAEKTILSPQFIGG